MTKNTLYLLAAIIAIIVIAALWLPKTEAPVPEASPANGLTGNTIKAAHDAVPPPSAPVAAPAGQVVPTPTTSQPPKEKAMDSDDVPASAEIAPAPTAAPTSTKPADDKGLVVPPSEGQ